MTSFFTIKFNTEPCWQLINIVVKNAWNKIVFTVQTYRGMIEVGNTVVPWNTFYFPNYSFRLYFLTETKGFLNLKVSEFNIYNLLPFFRGVFMP